MASENVYLLALAVVLCMLNVVLGGPVARGIARMFTRLSSPKAPELPGRADAADA
jgi:hypothetical protein